MKTTARCLAILTVLLGAGCVDYTGVEERSEAVEPASYVGTWVGTKTFLDAEGTVQGWTPDWPVEITRQLFFLTIRNGPTVHVAHDGSLVIDRHVYEPAYTPGPPGHCVPVVQVVTGGSGHLVTSDALHLEVQWTSTCGGTSAVFGSSYDLVRQAQAEPNAYSGL